MDLVVPTTPSTFKKTLLVELGKSGWLENDCKPLQINSLCSVSKPK